MKPVVTPVKEPEPTVKRRWSLLRTLGFQSDSPSPPVSPESPKGPANGMDILEVLQTALKAADAVDSQAERKPTFKFSLEWMPQPPLNPKDMKLDPIRLPATVQGLLDSLEEEESSDLDDRDEHTDTFSGNGTYVGRALAEWGLVIVQRDTFFERRMGEGKEVEQAVETPNLSWESLRKM